MKHFTDTRIRANIVSQYTLRYRYVTGSGLRPETRQKPDAPAACPTPRRPGKPFPPVPALSGGRFVRETEQDAHHVGDGGRAPAAA
ncbi:hypothetical protein GPC70_005006 [Salmonella enterica]|nr:hypothetical protein [Salmonella enterica]